MRRTLLATTIATLGAAPAAAFPYASAIDVTAAFREGAASTEGGVGGPDARAMDERTDGLLFVHGKKRLYRFVGGGEGGEGGEGRPVVVYPAVHHVPIVVSILGGPIAVILEPDWPIILEIEPQLVVAPIGAVIPWSNTATGRHGEVVVVGEGYDDQIGGYCRTYRTTVVIDGQPETATGTACQEPDGTWRIVE